MVLVAERVHCRLPLRPVLLTLAFSFVFWLFFRLLSCWSSVDDGGGVSVGAAAVADDVGGGVMVACC